MPRALKVLLFTFGLALTVSSLRAGQAPAQPAAASTVPLLAGTWQPSDPARSDVYFKNGIGLVPATGRLVIEQRPNRLTVTKVIPDEILDRLLGIMGADYPTTQYAILEPRGRSGGAGAGGDQRTSSWQGDRLVFRIPGSAKQATIAFSLDGERLKVETHAVIAPGKENRSAEWYTRVK